MRISIITLICAVALTCQGKSAYGQDLDSSDVRVLIEAKQFRFIAHTALTMEGQSIQLVNTLNSMSLTGDSVSASLPYYGGSFGATYGAYTDDALDFSTALARYQSKFKKNKWEISMRPKNIKNANAMILSVFPNGRATLMITSNLRQTITYNGYISTL